MALLLVVQGCLASAASSVEEEQAGEPSPARPCLASAYPIVFSAVRTPTLWGQLIVLEADGRDWAQVPPLPHAYSPAWSPDGLSIAFRRVSIMNDQGALAPSSIAVLATSRDDPREATQEVSLFTDESTPSRADRPDRGDGPSWAEDGQRLAFASLDPTGQLVIWSISRTGGQLRRLLPDFEAPHFCPRWSHLDPEQLVFVGGPPGDEDVWRVDVSNPGAAENLTSGTRDRFVGPRSPRWSPDETRLAFSAREAGSSEAGAGDEEIYLLDLASREVSMLTSNTAMDVSPAWSPDGGALLIASSRARLNLPMNSLDLWLLDLAGNEEPIRLTDEQGRSAEADWSSTSSCSAR
jgi:Tol biopolymer transport system component